MFMKNTIIAFTMLLLLVACDSKGPKEVPFTVAERYFFNNGQEIPSDPKITTEEAFKTFFGMATVMGEGGKPTPIDFDKQFVLAVVLPTTTISTDITPKKVEVTEDYINYSYDIVCGKELSYTIQPVSIIILDKKYRDKQVNLLPTQTVKVE